MLTGRGWSVVATGALLWVGARLVGADDLHIVAAGLAFLPGLAFLLMRWSRVRLRAARRLSLRRVPSGSRVRVSVELQNLGRARTSILLLEDRLPPALGRAARAVLDGLGGRSRQAVTYTLECGRRGRYAVGPLVVRVTDAFGLTSRRVAFPETHELIVYPEVEDLRAAGTPRSVGGSGHTSARMLHRTGEDFYTMRPYEIGDDLRRIHWPSTARMGNLMIRQDEAGRQASASIYLDTRSPGGAGFERAVSAAASVGSLYLREGRSLRLSTTDLPHRPVTGEAFLETLATVAPSATRSPTQALVRLRDRAGTGSSLVAILPLPTGDELTEVLRATRDHGHRLAVLLTEEGIEPERVRATRMAMARAGWETVILPPDRRLRDVWTHRTTRPVTTAASS